MNSMTPQQWAELEAFHRLHPIGVEKVCWTIAICFASLFDSLSAKGSKSVDPRRFMPWLRHELEDERKRGDGDSPDAAAAAFRLALSAAGQVVTSEGGA